MPLLVKVEFRSKTITRDAGWYTIITVGNLPRRQSTPKCVGTKQHGKVGITKTVRTDRRYTNTQIYLKTSILLLKQLMKQLDRNSQEYRTQHNQPT